MKKLRLFPLIVSFLLFSLFSPATSASSPRPPLSFFLPSFPPPGRSAVSSPSSWRLERVDAPKRFDEIDARSLALDSAGLPHLAYGADFLYYAWHDGTAWQMEVVDDSGGVGMFASLALDAQDRPHIAYFDVNNADLKYAYRDDAGWRLQTVDSAGEVGAWCSLALDAAGHPHLTYLDDTHDDLKYASFDGARWHFRTIDATGQVGWHSSLALDAQGNPHVTYFIGQGGGEFNTLRYAVLSGTTWLTETVNPVLEGGYFNSLALDSKGQPHVSYMNYYYGTLDYAYKANGAWHTETVDSNGDTGYYTSLALDADDHPHISYCPYGGWYNCGELRYAYFDGATWQLQVVDNSAAVGEFSSLALDAKGQPRIGYYDDTHARLKYAAYDGQSWSLQDVDQAGDTGLLSSLALDAQDRPHIAYCRYDPWVNLGGCAGLMYAWYDGSAWQIETVDSGGLVGTGISLALDSSGYAHISYSAFWPAGEVRYAYRDAQGWHVQVVAPVFAVSTSLALDTAGQPHLTYHDNRLWYAHWDGSNWPTEVVDGAEGGDTGEGSSLALDAAGRPHISYYAGGQSELRYTSWDGASWHSESLGFLSSSSGPTSLKLDAAGWPHISYYDTDTTGLLRYASYDGTQWRHETVDAGVGADWSAGTNLALDAAGWPHIGYADNNRHDLRYAHWNGTGWETETVDAAGLVGNYPSLALDGAGHPHLAYYDETNRDLKYASWREWKYHAYLPVIERGH